jgi:putative acetyltransferase
MATLEIRAETETDRAAIFEVEKAAFGQAAQAQLVDALRGAAEPHISLIAERAGRVVGHIFFSPVSFESPTAPCACQLSPLAVLPTVQRAGIGSVLIQQGLAVCSSIGWTAVFLLGNPSYYSRFGFQMAVDQELTHSGPDGEYLQYLELERRALSAVSGEVFFHPVFDDFE